MSNREIRIPHSEIDKPEKTTQATVNAFKREGLNIHHHEVDRIDDDFIKGQRILSVRKKDYFICPEMPWHKKPSP